MTRRIISLFMICIVFFSSYSFADSYDERKANDKLMLEKNMKDGFLSLRLDNLSLVLQTLSFLRNGKTERALENIEFEIALNAFGEGGDILDLLEQDIPGDFRKGEYGRAFEFLEYQLDILVWDIWKDMEWFDDKSRDRAVSALCEIVKYRQKFPRKKEADLSRKLKTIYPGELKPDIDYKEMTGSVWDNVRKACNN